MKLYFENSRSERRIIAEPQTLDDAWNEIKKFCDERNFKIYYVRTWTEHSGLMIYDVGSHTEFFILDDKDWNGDFIWMKNKLKR